MKYSASPNSSEGKRLTDTVTRADGGRADDKDEEREVVDLEVGDDDWLHDHDEIEEAFTFKETDEEQAQREADKAEKAEYIEEMAHETASSLLLKHVDGFDETDAEDRAEEVVSEYAAEHDIEQWDEDDIDTFEVWAIDNLQSPSVA